MKVQKRASKSRQGEPGNPFQSNALPNKGSIGLLFGDLKIHIGVSPLPNLSVYSRGEWSEGRRTSGHALTARSTLTVCQPRDLLNG